MNHATAPIADLDRALARAKVHPDCAGHGKCHGCLSWCVVCGDVFDICDSPRCDTHAPCDICGRGWRHCQGVDGEAECARAANRSEQESLKPIAACTRGHIRFADDPVRRSNPSGSILCCVDACGAMVLSYFGPRE